MRAYLRDSLTSLEQKKASLRSRIISNEWLMWVALTVLLVLPALQLIPVLFGVVTVALSAIFLAPIYFAKFQLMSTFYGEEDVEVVPSGISALAKTTGAVGTFYALGWGLACPVTKNGGLIVSSYLFIGAAMALLFWKRRKSKQPLRHVLRGVLFKYGLLIGASFSLAMYLFGQISFWDSLGSIFSRDMCGVYLTFQNTIDSLVMVFPAPFDVVMTIALNLNVAFGFVFVLYAYAICSVIEAITSENSLMGVSK